MRGYLVVYIGGYKYHYKTLTHLISRGQSETLAVPDTLMPPPLCEAGSPEWWENAWAVGDNLRARLCKPTSGKPLLKFGDFDEAVNFIFRRQQKHKKQQHALVYISRDAFGMDRYNLVRSLDDIAVVDAALDEEKRERAELKAAQSARLDESFPHLKVLRDLFGNTKATRMSHTIWEVRKNGIDATRREMPRSSWYRFLRDIQQAGIKL